MKFGKLIKDNRPELVVSKRHEEWMASNSNPTYSQEALDFGVGELEKQAHPRDRRGTYSGSSVNTCLRKQQFTFLGLPQLPPTTKLAGIFQNGTFTHIRWQMAGLTAGWLARAEVPVPENKLRLSGTQDGVCDDGSILEIKSINTNGFGSVMSFGPKPDHLSQGATYLACTDAEQAVFIYEDKNTQEYTEIVKTRDELPVREVEERAEVLWEMTELGELAEPLKGCEDRTGSTYNGCPFKEQCLGVRDWEHAKEMAA